MTTLENTFNTVQFVEPATGEISVVPSTRYRTIVDLKNFDDSEVNTLPSLTDTDNYIPLKEQIDRFFPQEPFDGYEDAEDFDADDVIDDKLDFVDHVVDKLENLPADDVVDENAGLSPEISKKLSVDEKSTGNEQGDVAPQ